MEALSTKEKAMKQKYTFILAALFSTNLLLGLEVGDYAPCVVLQDIQTNGQTINQCIRTRNQEGQHVILDFSLPECSDCAKNLPILAQLAGDTHVNSTTRVVLVSRDKEKIQQFLTTHKSEITFPVSLDTRQAAMRAYGVDAAPTIFVLDAKDTIVFKHVGVLSPAAVDTIKALVKASVP